MVSLVINFFLTCLIYFVLGVNFGTNLKPNRLGNENDCKSLQEPETRTVGVGACPGPNIGFSVIFQIRSNFGIMNRNTLSKWNQESQRTLKMEPRIRMQFQNGTKNDNAFSKWNQEY